MGAKNHYISRSVVPSGWYVSGGKKEEIHVFGVNIPLFYAVYAK